MPAYIIVDIEILDKEQYKEYIRLTPPTIAAFGGRFVVRGGESEVLEGKWQPNRLVVLEFKDVETAKRWWDSPEYAPAKVLRQKTANTNMVVVEGYAG